MSRASRLRIARVASRTLVLGIFASAATFAPGALAQPAADQYDLDIPRATDAGAGKDAKKSGDGDLGGVEPTTQPVSSTTTESYAPASEPVAPPATTSNDGKQETKNGGKRDRDKTSARPLDHSVQTVPAIAADSAGNGWVPLLLAGLAAIGALGAFTVYRRRRARG